MALCTLIIQDEVNCKFSNLDLNTRKSLVKEFRYFQQSARFSPAYKLGRWDGFVGYFNLGGNTYVNLLDRIIPIVQRNGYEIEIEDLRESPPLEFDKITTDYWGDKTWPVGHRFAGEPIRLREDQANAINIFLENPQSLQELSTSFGKTITCATMSHLCEKYGRTIIIVPNKSLVLQTEEDYRNVGLDVGVYFGDRKELNKTHTICTWQSLNVLDKKSKDYTNESVTLTEFLEGVAAVIVDEVHQASASALQRLLTQNLRNTPIRWGLTGTIPKDPLEFEAIRCSLGDVVNRVTAKELQDSGALSNCHIHILQTQEWKQFRTYQEELKYLVTDQTRIEWMAAQALEIAETGNTLFLVDRIETGKKLQAYINDLYHTGKIDREATFISGVVKDVDRKEEFTKIAEEDNKITIATFGVAAVGINAPRLFNIMLLEPGKSFVRVIQSIGRGLRKAKDKDFVNIYDITASTKYAKRHLTERKRYYKDAQYAYTVKKIKISP